MTNETAARFSAWLEAIRAWLRRRWIAALLVSVLLFVLKAFAEDATVKVVRVVGTFLGHFLSEIINGPVGITGLVFLALLGVLVVRAYWETRPQTAKGRAWLQVERLKLDKVIAENQHADDQRQLRERDATIKQQATALADREAQHRALFQEVTYGDSLIEPTPLDAANYAVLVARVEETKPTMEAAANAALKVWGHFRSQVATTAGKDSALGWLAESINDEAIEPAKRAYRLLDERLTTKGDPRPALAVFYARYCDLRTWILRYAQVLHQNLYTAEGSVEWHTHDTQYFKDLEQSFKTSIFAEVRNAARAYKEDYGEQHPLPDPP